MKRLIPDSIAGRILLALLVGLTISHALSLWLYYGDRNNIVAVLSGSEVAERIATITRVVGNASGDERRRIAEAATSPTLRVDWKAQSTLSGDGRTDWRTRLMRDALLLVLTGIDRRQIRIAYADAAAADGHFGMGRHFLVRGGAAEMMQAHMRQMGRDMSLGQELKVSVQLADGTWLNFVAPEVRPASIWSFRFVLSVFVMILAITALSIWVVRRFTAPLALFTNAASQLGRNVNAPRLPETGPREVRRSARAFNEMQDRIRRFVEDRTQMVAAISHDLRTPITRLRLRADEIEDEQQQARMIKDLDEMETMISAVLSFAREDNEAEQQSRLDLGALLQSICDDMADVGRAVTMEHAAVPPITGQRLALRRAFTNLIDNAVNYGKCARVRLYEEANAVRVQIDDDGPGIPESEREQVFAPFYRLEKSRNREVGGAGLGLAITRSVIRRHGGEIELHNRPEGGLRVLVELPRADHADR